MGKKMRKRPVIVWGHPLHSHTHSYIHYGFYKALSMLGIEAYWLWEDGDIPQINDAVVITEGQVDSNIPLRKDWCYLLHNCDTTKYEEFGARYKVLQVYSHDCLERDVEKIAECEYYQASNRTLYQPWATDLFPSEIERMPLILTLDNQAKKCNWVGSLMQGEPHGNVRQLTDFGRRAHENGVAFEIFQNIEPMENIKLVKESYLAPALQGQWQVDNGYIPCRIFKNISYGQLGVTNSKAVYDLLGGQIAYNSNCADLFDQAVEEMHNTGLTQRLAVLDNVKHNHTYVNRIKNILEIMEDC